MKNAVERAINRIEEMAGVKCSPFEYMEGLEEVQAYVEVCIEACKEDISRAKAEE